MHNLFSTSGAASSQAPTSPIGQLMQHVSTSAAQQGGRFVQDQTVRAALSLESFTASGQHELTTSLQTLQSIIQSAASQAGFTIGGKNRFGKGDLGDMGRVTLAQESAAMAAGILASSPRSALTARAVSRAAIASKFGESEFVTVFGNEGVADAMESRPMVNGRLASEAYDERENREAVAYSVAYNMASARQDEFAEAFFPTVTVTPDMVGYNVSARLFYVENEVRHSVTGSLANFGRVNILKAVVDPTILRNDDTLLVPVVRTGGATDSTASFVAAADVAPHSIVLAGNAVTTAPLAVGKKINLLGLSQTDALVAAGVMDNSDALDSSLRLGALYIKLGANGGNKVLKFNTSSIPGSDYNFSVQGNTRQLTLNFSTDSLKVVATSTDVAGAAVTQLSALADKTVRLSTSAFSNVLQDKGEGVLQSPSVDVATVTDATGVQLSTGSGAGATIAAVFAGAAVIGYDLIGHRTNSNRRQRGQLVNIQHVSHLYTVPFLPPVTALRPVGDTEANDSDAIEGLITTTRIRTSNSAVTELFNGQQVLKDYISAADLTTNQPEVLGVARYLVKAQYTEAVIDCATDLDSLTSSKRPEDLVALIINVIRDMAYRMYTGSAYKAAADALSGGVASKPLLIIGTDSTLARYLTLVGDTRTFGEYFDFKLVQTLDQRMANKIVFSFGTEAAYNSGTPHPLHYGSTAWCPEAVTTMPMVRNGAISQELTVAPRYRHVTNLPILGVITVANVDTVMSSKVTVNVSQ